MSRDLKKDLDDEIDYNGSSPHEVHARARYPSVGCGIEIVVRGYGGAYDGGGQVAHFAAIIDIGPQDAYRIASELCMSANLVREAQVAARDDRRAQTPNLQPEQEIPGPFIVARARKATPEERSSTFQGPIDFGNHPVKP